MQEWLTFKSLILEASGLGRDALHIYLSLVALLLLSAALRRPITSVIPWLALALIAVANEAESIFFDGRAEDWEIAVSRHDLIHVLMIPTVLLLAGRILPRLMAPPPVRRLEPLRPIRLKPEQPVYAEYEVIEVAAERPKETAAQA